MFLFFVRPAQGFFAQLGVYRNRAQQAPTSAAAAAAGTSPAGSSGFFRSAAARAEQARRAAAAASAATAMTQASLGPPGLTFHGLRIKLGPELRAVYPFVLNFGLAGHVDLFGAADAARLRPSGIVTFDSGDVNLVATQAREEKRAATRGAEGAACGLRA